RSPAPLALAPTAAPAPPPPAAKVLPTRDSVLEKFASDLQKYGTYNGDVLASPTSQARTGFTRAGTSLFSSKKVFDGVCNLGGWESVKLTDVEIEENEGEVYPYVATVSYENKGHCLDRRTPGHDGGFDARKGAVKYLYGGKTNKWKRQADRGL